jgi:hypothetical protein
MKSYKASDVLVPQDTQYCFPIPSHWTHHAKFILRQSIIQAGLVTSFEPRCRLQLVPEIHSVAAYAVSVGYHEYFPEPGQVFMMIYIAETIVEASIFNDTSLHSNRNYVAKQNMSFREVLNASLPSVSLSADITKNLEAYLRRLFVSRPLDLLKPTTITQIENRLTAWHGLFLTDKRTFYYSSLTLMGN